MLPAVPPAPALVLTPPPPADVPAVLCIAPPLPELASPLLLPPLPLLEALALPAAVSAAEPVLGLEPPVEALEQPMQPSAVMTRHSPNLRIRLVIEASIATDPSPWHSLARIYAPQLTLQLGEQLACRTSH